MNNSLQKITKAFPAFSELVAAHSAQLSTSAKDVFENNPTLARPFNSFVAKLNNFIALNFLSFINSLHFTLDSQTINSIDDYSTLAAKSSFIKKLFFKKLTEEFQKGGILLTYRDSEEWAAFIENEFTDPPLNNRLSSRYFTLNNSGAITIEYIAAP